jgi:hypothetical protein
MHIIYSPTGLAGAAFPVGSASDWQVFGFDHTLVNWSWWRICSLRFIHGQICNSAASNSVQSLKGEDVEAAWFWNISSFRFPLQLGR